MNQIHVENLNSLGETHFMDLRIDEYKIEWRAPTEEPSKQKKNKIENVLDR